VNSETKHVKQNLKKDANQRWRRAIQWYVSILFLCCLSCLSVAPAATIIVNTFDGGETVDGDCSIAEAVDAANDNVSVDGCSAGDSGIVDVIVITGSGTIDLEQTLFVSEAVTITGSSTTQTRLSGQGERSILGVVMQDPEDDFTLTRVTLEDATNTLDNLGRIGGAVLLIQGDEFTFREVHFNNNREERNQGGAIFAGPLDGNSDSRLIIDECEFNDNFAVEGGGAIASFRFGNVDDPQPLSAVEITATQFNRNTVPDTENGGALFFIDVDNIIINDSQFMSQQAGAGGVMSVSRNPNIPINTVLQIRGSSFINNQSRIFAGAVLMAQTDALMENNTFTENNITDNNLDPSALNITRRSSASIHYSTFFNNSATNLNAPSISVCADCAMSLRSSIVWTDTDDAECFFEGPMGSQPGADYTSLGNNMDGSGTCASGPNDLPMTNPLLLPLAAYGDEIPSLNLLTLLPSSNSMARDGADSGTCPGVFGLSVTRDQRDFPKPRNACDIGAVEYQPNLDPADFPLNIDFIGDGAGEVVSTPFDIVCDDSCSTPLVENSMVSLTPNPEINSTFVSWGGSCSGQGACIVTMDQARNVSVNFELMGFNLNVSVIGSGRGQVNSNPLGISCPSDCTETFAPGQPVTLTPQTATRNLFAGWSGDCSGTGSCVVVMDQVRNVTAMFDQGNLLTVTVKGQGGVIISQPGGISCPDDCTEFYNEGQLINLFPDTQPGFEFLGWSGACTGNAACFVDMDQARNVTATFGILEQIYSDGFEVIISVKE